MQLLYKMLKAFGYIFNTQRVPDVEELDFESTSSGSDTVRLRKRTYEFEIVIDDDSSIVQLVVP